MSYSSEAKGIYIENLQSSNIEVREELTRRKNYNFAFIVQA